MVLSMLRNKLNLKYGKSNTAVLMALNRKAVTVRLITESVWVLFANLIMPGQLNIGDMLLYQI